MLFGLGLATGLEFYTFDAVNLVLPDMAGSFGVSRDEASWLLTSYSAALFLGVPLSIWLASRIGHRRFLIFSVMIFAASSLSCSLSLSFAWLLIGRIVEGFAGAGLTMWWRASVYMLMTGPARSNSLMRISVMLYLSTAIGMIFAGYMTDKFTWRFIFLPNVIAAMGAIWLLVRHYPAVTPVTKEQKTDLFGIFLLAAAIICAQVALSRGDIEDWLGSSFIRTISVTASIAFIFFIWWETSKLNENPILKLNLFKHRAVISAVFLGIFAGFILSGSIYALPEFLRTVNPYHLSALQTASVMCTYALVAACIRPLVTMAITRFGQRKVLTFSFTILIVAMISLSRLVTLPTPIQDYRLPLALYAFCLAPLLSSVGGGTVAKMQNEVQLDAVAIYMTFRTLGASLGVAVISILLNSREALHSGRLYEDYALFSLSFDGRQQAITTILRHRDGITSSCAHIAAMKVLSEQAVAQAETLAYADAFFFMACVGCIALLFIPLMPRSPGSKKRIVQQ